MMAAARKAGRPLVRDFGELGKSADLEEGAGRVSSPAPTSAPRKILIEELSKARPGYGFLAEESGAVEGKDKSHRFIIDPIDGTTNFMHGVPHFAPSHSRWNARASWWPA